MAKFSLDDLRKMGSDLLDTAKAANIGGMVDKVKTGLESTMKPKVVVPTHTSLADIYANFEILIALQADQQQIISTLKMQLANLEHQLIKPTSNSEPETSGEKNNFEKP